MTATFDVAEAHHDDVQQAIERGELVVKGEFVAHVVERKISISAGETVVKPDE